jgi:ABC-type multidrug transport system ATPase subunit/ABC-type multidrug transport system permease subunit
MRDAEEPVPRGSRKRIAIAMDDDSPQDEPRRGPGRLRIDLGPEPTPPSTADAALLVDGELVPLSDGIRLAWSPGAGLRLGDAPGPDDHAAIHAVGGEHVLECGAGTGALLLNGERLAGGERRQLQRGDAIAVGAAILYFRPAGQGTLPLAPVGPVDAGRVRATTERYVIGRADDCDLVLDHPTVSRRHAVIRSIRGQATIEDAGSSSGVRLNGRAIRRQPIAVGDQIGIGPFRIVYDGHELIERRLGHGLPVAAHGVSMAIGGATILHPVDLHLRPGELVAIIGESGAGKSTLLKALAGVTQPTGGRVLVAGEDVGAHLSELGYVPQFDVVHEHLTVVEALDFAARLRLPSDTSPGERADRVGSVIEQLGLGERAGVRVGRLSGGQRKRVAVGTELLHMPGALFLDEPTTGLDPGLERRLMEQFRALADGGQTVALVTHATGSLALCDRVVVMGRGGHLRFDGTPRELKAAYAVESFEDVYAALAAGDGTRASLPVERGEARRALPPLSTPRAQRPVQQPFAYQTRMLARRYATLLTRDRKYLRSALVQVPVLGLMTGLLFERDVFIRAAPGVSELFAGKTAQLVFLMVTIAIWLGSIDAAREVVKERNVLARELAVGVQVPAYLASKLIVLLALATVQTLLFAVIVVLLRPLHEGADGFLALCVVLVLSSWLAVLCGLVVSAYAATEDQATGVIPLLLVPQLLFGGAIVPLAEMTGAMQAVAALVPARWSFDAAGHAVDMQARIAEDPVFVKASHYGDGFFSTPLPLYVLICGAFAGALLFALSRLVPSRRGDL